MKPVYEKVPNSPESSFCCYLRKAPAFPFEWHYHPEYELTAILAGTGRRLVGDSAADFRPGDLVLVGPDLPHTWHSSVPGPGGDCAAVVVQFAGGFLGAGFFDRVEMRGPAGLLAGADRGLVFGRRTWRQVEDAVGRLVATRGFERLIGLLRILRQLSSAPDARPLSGAAVKGRAGDRERFNEVFRFLSANLDRRITRAEAAAAAGMSPSNFSRFFKRVCGRGFVTCLNELRVSRACGQLAETDRGIAEICFAAGFRNVSNFNRQFRKIKGCCPKDYRAEFTE